MDRPDNDLNTPEDFLQDENFRRWVKYQRPQDKVLWEDFLTFFPERRPAYESAVATLLVIFGNSAAEADDGAGKLRGLLETEAGKTGPIPLWRWLRWSAAAVLVIGLGFWWSKGGREGRIAGNGIATIAASDTSQWTARANHAQDLLLVNLPDGSSVLLSKNSSIRFGKDMDGNEREVFLDGEGFFEVVKNPSKPFLVHTDKLTTRVLGTSFRVRSFPGQADAEVVVKTGKVVVMTADNAAGKPLTLYPNQRVSLTRKKGEMFSAITEPVNAGSITAIEAEPFDFQFTPVSEAFKILESHYAVKIHFDPEKLGRCTVTASLKDEPFLEKIRLICLATETSYVLNGDDITITGHGCP